MRHSRWLIGVVALALGTASPAQTVGGGARLEVGREGLWVAASEAPSGPQICAIDGGAGQAGFYGVLGAGLSCVTPSGWGA